METQVTVSYEPKESEPFKAKIGVLGNNEQQRNIIEYQLDIPSFTTDVLKGKESIEISSNNKERALEIVDEKVRKLNRLIRKVRFHQAEAKEWLSTFKKKAETEPE